MSTSFVAQVNVSDFVLRKEYIDETCNGIEYFEDLWHFQDAQVDIYGNLYYMYPYAGFNHEMSGLSAPMLTVITFGLGHKAPEEGCIESSKLDSFIDKLKLAETMVHVVSVFYDSEYLREKVKRMIEICEGAKARNISVCWG